MIARENHVVQLPCQKVKQTTHPQAMSNAVLVGDRWTVSGVHGKKDAPEQLTVTIGNQKEKVFIEKVTFAVITVVGKCAAVVISQVENSGIIVDGVVSGIEAVNSSKLQIEARGPLPQIQIDKVLFVSSIFAISDLRGKRCLRFLIWS